jgi:hypothetical protein
MTANGRAVCGASHNNINGTSVKDYVPHHEPFQYYNSTENPHHLPPTSVAMIGHTDHANHQYDLTDLGSLAIVVTKWSKWGRLTRHSILYANLPN